MATDFPKWLVIQAATLGAATVPDAPPAPDVASSSDEYAKRFSGAVGAWHLRVQNAAILKLLAKRNCSSILEVGGGHGQDTDDLIAAGYHLTVLGSVPATALRIQSQISAGKCRFATGDFLKLPFPDRAFDGVVSIRQLAHVDDPARFVAELCRVARLSVVVDFPPRQSFNVFSPLLFPLKFLLEKKSTRTFAVFTAGKIERMFSANGFRISGREPQFCAPMVFHRLVRWVGLLRAIEGLCRALGLTARMGAPVLLSAERELPTGTEAAGAAFGG